MKVVSGMLHSLLLISLTTFAFHIQLVGTVGCMDDYCWIEGDRLNVGFSKYGEMTNPDVPVGLRYGPVDPFANTNVSMVEWNEGWLMNITYEYEGATYNVWAYALFSDFRATEGDWIVNASSPLDYRPGYRGGRKTSGYATTEPIEILYDDPEHCAVLLKTRVYDPRIPNPKDPDDPKGLPLVDLHIQVVFNKAKKYVLLIKDIRLSTESKLLKKVHVKFGQRGEWDLGWEPEPWLPRGYAHFYHDLPTECSKHPWYMTDDNVTSYDLVQIIDQSETFVAYAAYWPGLMSWRVEAISKLTGKDKLTDLSDWEHHWLGEEYTEEYEGYLYLTSIPGYYQDMLSYPDCEFPPNWSYAEPEVYVDGVKQTEGVDYDWDYYFGEPGGYNRPSPGVCDDAIAGEFALLFYSKPADAADIHVHWKLHAEQDDMTCEPRTPYTMGEWVFDLSYDDEDLPTEQFRCVTVYGISDLTDGDDSDIGSSHLNVIDSEVVFELPLLIPYGDIYIRPDGRVDPPTAPIQRDRDIYTLIDNVNDEIIVQRDNIVVDGAGHILHGTGSETGIDLTGGSNVTIRNMEIKAFRIGIYLDNSSRNRIVGNRIRENIQGIYVYGSNEPPETESWYNTIVGNDITENGGGILLEEAKFNNVSGNNITENHGNVDYPLRPGGIYIFLNSLGNVVSGNNIINNEQSGIYFHYCTTLTPEWFNVVRGNNIINNSAGIRTYHGDGVDIFENNIENNNVGLDLKPGIVTAYHNNFINNTMQVEYPGINTIWDDGYPSGGNYWSDHTGPDSRYGRYQNLTGSDGIVDTPYVIDAGNQDNYPLMSPYQYWVDPIPGDINRDGKVDFDDIVGIAMAYGSKPSDPNWNPNADIDRDGDVDFDDVVTAAMNYGKEK